MDAGYFFVYYLTLLCTNVCCGALFRYNFLPFPFSLLRSSAAHLAAPGAPPALTRRPLHVGLAGCAQADRAHGARRRGGQQLRRPVPAHPHRHVWLLHHPE